MKERKLFFTSDAFGQHTGNNISTDSDLGEDELLIMMKIYYAQVFSQVIKPTLDMVSNVEKLSTGAITPVTAGEEYKTKPNISGILGLLPAHGVAILRQPAILRSLQLYRRWAQQIPVRKVVILYESMYDTTAKMARKLKETIEQQSAEMLNEEMKKLEGKEGEAHPSTPVVCDLLCARRTSVLDVVGTLLDTPVVLLGTSAFNNAPLPNLQKLLCIVRSYRWKEKACFCFGSYGWSNMAIKELEKIATNDLKWKLLGDSVSCINEVDDGVMKKIEDMGKLAFKEAIARGNAGGCLDA